MPTDTDTAPARTGLVLDLVVDRVRKQRDLVAAAAADTFLLDALAPIDRELLGTLDQIAEVRATWSRVAEATGLDPTLYENALVCAVTTDRIELLLRSTAQTTEIGPDVDQDDPAVGALAWWIYEHELTGGERLTPWRLMGLRPSVLRGEVHPSVRAAMARLTRAHSTLLCRLASIDAKLGSLWRRVDQIAGNGHALSAELTAEVEQLEERLRATAC